jgi:predicted restriction endonuclease
MPYIENEQDFRFFMDKKGPKAYSSKINYISWLRYLSNEGITIDSHIPSGDDIVSFLEETEANRAEYTDRSHYGDFKSAVNKYRQFIDTFYVSLVEDIKVIYAENIDVTEKDELIKARIGQGIFRKKLIELWGGCSVTSVSRLEFLVASHILPWRYSTNNERLNPYNGLLLQPNFDIFFDKGYISFEDNGNIILSNRIEEEIFNNMGVFSNNKLFRVFDENKPFLQKHREIFKELLFKEN